MKLICPTCNETYKFSEKDLSKIGYKAACKRCGASLVFLDKPLAGMTEVIMQDKEMIHCPRCGYEQGASEQCVNCGVVLSEDKKGMDSLMPDEGPVKISERKQREKHLNKLGIGAALLIGLIVSIGVVAFFYWMINSEPCKLSRSFIRENEAIRSVVGEDISFGLFPTGSIKTGPKGGAASFTFNVKGSTASAKAYIALRKDHGRWRVISASLKDRDGRIKTIFRERVASKRGDGIGILSKEEQKSQKHIRLAHKHFRKNSLGKALEEYDKSIEVKNDNPEAYYWRGQLFLKKGENDKAIADFKRAVELNPSHADAYGTLGWLCNEKAKYDEGIEYLTRSIELKPDNGWAYYNRGHSYFKKGDLETALKDAKKACELGYRVGCKVYKKFKR